MLPAVAGLERALRLSPANAMSLITPHLGGYYIHMTRIEFLQALRTMDRRGVYVFSRGDLAKIFHLESEKTLEKSLARMVAAGLIVRASKGIYVNPDARSASTRVIEDVALALRRGHYSYVSLESALSEHGLISQIPMRLTVMTTGASGTYDTAYGTIEFTHTRRSIAELLGRSIKDSSRPLRFARKRVALQDLLRVGRNTNMLDEDELAEMEKQEQL